ncbi:hypothetical protein OpiT1DRAFT_01014 [Opitutaceae bacterium TAV1]|nr:hypothetical protein OpiT1DRAFT_01014 [Opitutaceae bacterium TAV1]
MEPGFTRTHPFPLLLRRADSLRAAFFLVTVSCVTLAPTLPVAFATATPPDKATASQTLATDPAVAGALERLEGAFAGVIPWVLSLADEDSGGFFESAGLKNGRENRPWEPDIQSSFFAVQILHDSGQLARLPASRKQAIVRFFQSRQDPATGFFSDPSYPEMKDDTRTMGRALMFSVSALRYLGAQPLHPLPGERSARIGERPALRTAGISLSFIFPKTSQPSLARKTASSPIPAHLATDSAFREWLDALPWDNAWTSLDKLSSQARLIRAQESSRKNALVAKALRNVRARQDPATGLVGGGRINIRLSGAFKLVAFCRSVGQPVPLADRLLQTTLDWYRGQPATDVIFFIRNASEMLSVLVKETGYTLSPSELCAIIDTSRIELTRFQCPDGAFSRRVGRYTISPNDLYHLPARAGQQGDLNATSSAWALRKALWQLAHVPPPLLAVPATTENPPPASATSSRTPPTP